MSNGNNKKTQSPESTPSKSKPDSALNLLSADDIAPEIYKRSLTALQAAHYAAWIPNSAATLVTSRAVMELPPGSVLILVFDDTEPAYLPDGFEVGVPFILELP